MNHREFTRRLVDAFCVIFGFFAINQVLGHFKENTRSLQLVCAELAQVCLSV